MKKLFLCLIVSIAVLSVTAQEIGKIRVGADLGVGIPSMGGGLTGDIDARLNIKDNLNIGFKFGWGMLLKDAEMINNNIGIATLGVLSSFSMVSDYYFNKGTSSFAPFIGGGLGSFTIMNAKIDASKDDDITNALTSNLKPDKKLGAFIHTGFEIGKIRLGLEYYMIPRSTLYNILLEKSGTTSNNYLNLTLGFYLGGGSWKK